MDDTLQVMGHAGFTWGAWLTSHYTEVGACVLMVLQGVLLVWKLYDKCKGRDRRKPE